MSGRKLACGVLCLLLLSMMEAQAARATASATDSRGNVYVTGWRVISEDPLLVDIVTIKYDRNGTKLWSHSFPDDPARPDSEGWEIAVDRISTPAPPTRLQ